MFENTRDALLQVKKTFIIMFNIFKYGYIFISLLFFIVALINKTGNFVINLITTIIFIIYTVFEISTRNLKIKSARKKVKRIYKWTRLTLKLFIIIAMILGFYSGFDQNSFISKLLLIFMVTLWLIQFTLEIIIFIISSIVKTTIEGIKADVNNYNYTNYIDE